MRLTGGDRWHDDRPGRIEPKRTNWKALAENLAGAFGIIFFFWALWWVLELFR